MKYIFFLFFLSTIQIAFSQSETVPAVVIDQAITEENRLINKLHAGIATDLPVGIASTLAGQEYVIGIEDIVLTPGGSYLSATAAVQPPLSEEKLAFRSTNIAIGPGGIKSQEGGQLQLASDISVNLNNNVKLNILSGQRKTFVSFDCNGFKSMGLSGSFEFCRNYLLPENPDGSIAPEPARVTASFETTVTDAGNFLAEVSISPFQIPALKGFGFTVKNAWVDRSDMNNPLGLIFPPGYTNPDISEGDGNRWQGFFIGKAAVKLPAMFNTNNSTARKEIDGYNLIIDNMGLSGTFAAVNILNFNDGNLSGWPFSVDSIACTLACNKIASAGFKGTLNLPIAKEDTRIGYTAFIQDGDNYAFSVRSLNTLQVPLWSATMHLYPTSSIGIAMVNDKFQATANLDGDINISPDLGNGGDKSGFKGIKFEGMRVSSVKPYFSPGTFTIASTGSNMAGFALTLNEIGVVSNEDKVGLHLGLALHLMGEDDMGFSGTTGLDIMGKMETGASGKQRWVFDGVQLDNVSIDIDQGAYTIQGSLAIYKQHTVYGNGFMGAVKATFKPGLEVSSKAQFGNVKGYRYWYVDGLLKLPQGIPIMTGFALYGFGGGMYHHMKQGSIGKTSVANAPSGYDATPSAGVQQVSNPVSGISYVPDENVFLGLKATLLAGTYPNAQAFNASATFEMAFNNKGLSYVGIYGDGYFMSQVGAGSSSAPVHASVKIDYDFTEEILHGVFEVFINVDGVLQGIQPGNLAGSAVFHIEKKDWYIHVGTPSARVGVKILGICEATSYFMVGTVIEPMPPPDSIVSNILGKDLNFMRKESQLKSAGGFAFGSTLSINTGKMQFLMFYGQFNGGGGFDVMLQKWESPPCLGLNGNFGINGWYASGQAYAYIKGEIGIEVDLLFIHGKYKVIELGVAAILQAKLPNPSYIEGNVGGYYSILNGKIKGHCLFTMSIGKQCIPVTNGSVVSGLKIIADMSPRDGETAVSVFNNPQAAFNLALEKSFDMEDLDGVVKTFRPRLGHFKVLDNGKELPGQVQWDASGEAAAYQSSDVFASQRKLTASVRVYFEEYKNGNWQGVLVDGKLAEESREVSFTSGDAPDVIPAGNVAYSYPVINQYNFYKSEYPAGYIKLIKGQPDLFAAGKWNHVARFITDNGKAEASISYDAGTQMVGFTIPPSLHNEKVYNYSLVNIPSSQTGAVDANVKTIQADSNQTVSMASKEVQGNREVLQEKNIYSQSFRTSRYNTFSDKVNSWNISQGWSFPVTGYEGVHLIGVNISAEELLEEMEESGGLLSIQALPTNQWYRGQIYPLIYQTYLLNGASITWRDTSLAGLPPLRAIEMQQGSHHYKLSDGASPGSVHSSPGNAQLVYDLPFYAYRDYDNIRQQCANRAVTNQGNSDADKILNTPFPDIESGRYEVNLNYTLPGIKKVSSVNKLTIKNP